MPKWVYIGGQTKSEHFSEGFDGKPGIDERHGVDMPDVTTAFGLKWIINQPVDVSRDKFESDEKFRHALKKLEVNRYFKPFAEEASFEMVEPERPPRAKPGPKPRQQITQGMSEDGVG